MIRICVAATALTLGLASSAAGSEPSYKLNKSQTKVVSLSGLGSGACLPDGFSGRVVSKQYASNGVVIQAFAIEHEDGDRSLINIDTDHIGTANRLTIGWVHQGLQQFLREGRMVSLGLLRCGAAGRVLYLDSIKPR